VTYGDQSRVLGEEAASYGQKIRHAQTHEEAACILAEQLRKGDTLLIKGSRLMKLEIVMQKLVESLSSDILVNQESKE
jgi:UDP-N-acetylmuramyl pentapeptide synthase